MNFVSKCCVIKVYNEIGVIYCKKKQLLLIKTQSNFLLLHLNFRIFLLKHKNFILVTNKFTNKVLNLSKILQGVYINIIKQSLINVRYVIYKQLYLVGVGYKVFSLNYGNQKFLKFKLGYSHSLYYKIPKYLSIKIRKSVKIFIIGLNLFKILQCVSRIKLYKTPEPYKGKGVLVINKVKKLKETKNM